MANDKEAVIDLDLSLCLRPPKNVLEGSDNEVDLFRKREEQAIRRREAKVKRDLKRKGSGDGEVWGNGRRKNENVMVDSTVRWLGGNCGNNRCSVSSGSSDDNYCSNNSAPGGHSSDTSSHSSHPHLHLPASDVQTPTSSLKQPTSSPQQDTPNYSNQRHPLTNSISPSKSPEFKIPSKASKEATLQHPPKPNGQTKRQESGSMPQMPCVTTTGNGPKGKTITGFLYKYTKKEVSIVCVCHGASFTPAGFVEHAGGVDVEHPLRHIKVASFPLG